MDLKKLYKIAIVKWQFVNAVKDKLGIRKAMNVAFHNCSFCRDALRKCRNVHYTSVDGHSGCEFYCSINKKICGKDNSLLDQLITANSNILKEILMSRILLNLIYQYSMFKN